VSHEVRSIDEPAVEPTIDAAEPAAERAEEAVEAARGILEPFEVFRQEKEGDAMKHGGSVMAPDPELAVFYARELYGRRQESLRLWVVRRADIAELDDPDLLQPPLDRSFKKPGGYVMRDKLAKARERSGAEKPKARAASHDTTGRRGEADAGEEPAR
jgi:ring-1,2-phenylacetyl-CoA epoxidase subunit PaaB